MIVSFRSPEVAVPIFRSLSLALGERHKFVISSPLSLTTLGVGRANAAEALEIYQRRRCLGHRAPLTGLRRLWYLESMAAKYAGLRAMLERHRPSSVFVWNGERGRGRALAQASRELGIRTLVFEHSPIPGTITIDPLGVNARAAVPRDPDFFRHYARRTGPVDWRSYGLNLKARPPRKVLHAEPVTIPENYVFLPLQVATDTQILLHGRWVPSIGQMLTAAIRQIPRLPTGWALVVKEHPSCKIGNAKILKEHAHNRLVVAEAEDTFALVAGARGVVTLNSSVGLQSFFFDKPVCVLGDAFYRQPGLVEIADSEEDLGRQFERAASWQFDPALRDAFMSYLCRDYYVPISEQRPLEVSERAVGMVKSLLSGPALDQLDRSVLCQQP